MNDINLFIASTAFQVFNIINIASNVEKNNIADVILLRIDNNTEMLKRIIERTNLFRNVYIVDIGFNEYNSKVKYYINRVKKSLFIEKDIPNCKCKYKSIYIVGTEIFSKAIYCFFYQKYKLVELVYYEDGLGSYNLILTKKFNRFRDVLLRIKYHRGVISRCSKMLAYKPNSVYCEYPQIRIEELPTIDKNSKYASQIREWFKSPIKNYNSFDNKIIFLDSNWNNVEINELQNICVNRLMNEYDLLIKLHPSSPENKYGISCKYIRDNASFEIFEINHSLNNTVLVTVASTAALTNMEIFDEMPYIIMLYKIVDKKYSFFENNDEVISMLFRNREKIFIPNSYKELDNILKKVISKER